MLGAFAASAALVGGAGARLVEGDTLNPTTSPACRLMPIATRDATIASATVGAEIPDILNADRPGQRGWLTWAGDVNEPTLAASLTLPGNSQTYIDPDERTDRTISVGDWVRGKPGVVNSRAVRDALEKLVGREVIVVVWDTTRAQGSKAAFRVSGFARVSITRYDLPNDNRISARYLGPAQCPPPPEAVPTSAQTAEDTAVSIGLTGRSAVPGTLTFFLTQPLKGSAAIQGPAMCATVAGAVGPASCSVTARYAPAQDENGADAFTFTVDDGELTSPPAGVTVDVSEVNDPPVTAPDTAGARAGTALQIPVADVLSNDRAGPPNEAAQKLTVSGVSTGPDSHGTATLAGGTITYTPDPGYVGPATVTYSACDDGTTAGRADPRCTPGAITITVQQNQPPTAGEQNVTTAEDTPLAVTLTGDDPEDDPLTFAVTASPAHGNLSGTAPNLTYTPAADFFGSDSFTFTASDGRATSVATKIQITVTEVNDTPAPETDAFAVGVTESTVIPAAFVLWNDVAGPANEAGQRLDVGAVAATPDSHGVVSLAGESIVYRPDPGFSGTATIGYTLCDKGTTNGQPDPLCDTGGSVTLSVTAADRPPVADPQQLETAEDHSLPLTLTAVDPDDDPVTYKVLDGPEHGSLTGTAPALTYEPEPDYFGDDGFTFTASDGQVSSEPAPVAIKVTEVNDPPVLGLDTRTLGGVGTLPPLPPPPACTDPCGVIYGDPHAVTYDQGPYEFQAHGEFIATKSTRDDFELQVRTQPVPNSRLVSLVVGVGLRVAGHRVSIYRTLTGADTRIDGVKTDVPAFPQALPGGGTIGTYGFDNTIFVVWPDGTVAQIAAVGLWPEFYRFSVSVHPALGQRGHLVGLLGDADDQRPNDLVTRDGQQIDFPEYPVEPDFDDVYHLFGHSWRISQAESLLDYGPGETTETFTDRTFPDRPARPADLPPGVLGAATAQCNAFGLTVPALRDACVVDLGLTGDPEFATSAADAQEASFAIPTNTGVTSVGEATTVTVDTAGTQALRAFSAVAGQKVTLKVTGNTIPVVDVTVRRPDGSILASLTVSDEEAFHDVITLPVDGTYTIAVDPRDDNTGSLTFSLNAVPENTGAAAIGVPTTVMIGTVGENAVRSFTADAGQLVTLSVTGNTIPAVDLVVKRPDGSILESLTVSAADGFHDTFMLPVSGTYTITVDPREQYVGALTFALNSVPVNTGTTAIGTPTTVSIGTVGENAVRSFTAQAGQLVTLSVTGNTIAVADLVVRRPDGSIVTSLTASGDSGFHDTFTLGVDGTYTITVDPREQHTGSLTFTLGAVPANTGTTAIGTPTAVTIGTVGENAVRSFTAHAAQQVTLAVTGNTIPVVDLVVREPDGSFVANLALSTATGFHDPITLPVSGTYTITVDPREQHVGALTFTLNDLAQNSGDTAIGIPTTVTIATPGQTGTWTFAATAGQKVTLTVTGNTIPGVDLTIRQPNGTFVGSLFLSVATGFRDVLTLPVTGTYTLTVDPSVQNTGSLTFTLGSVPDNTGTTSIGTATDVTIGTVGENAVRSFSATAGQKVTLTVTGNTIPGVDLTIRQPNGTFVGSLFLSSATAFRDVLTLPVTGTYTITVDPSGQTTGSLTFMIGTVPDNTGTTSIGTATDVTIGTIGENAVRSFDATAGQKVTLTVTGNTIPGVDLTIRQPNGTFVGSLFLSSATAFRDVLTLPVTGTYTITVDPSGQTTGSLTFTLRTVPDNTGTTTIGTATAITIGTVGENAVRSFAATAGQKVTLTVTGNSIPGVELAIRQPNGNFLGSLFLSGTSGFRDVLTLPVTGTYTITVDPSGQNTGSLSFTIGAVPDNTGTTSIGTPAPVTITVPGENAVRSFTATAGQRLTLAVTGNTIPGVELEIDEPDGSFVDSLFLSGATGFLDEFTLPVDGTYTITVDPSGQNVGQLTFLLQPPNTGATSIGTPTPVTIGSPGATATRTFTGTANQILTMSVSGNTIPGGVFLTVTAPDESFVGDVFASAATGFSDALRLPVTGTYTVTIEPIGVGTGALTFLLSPVPQTSIGAATTVTIGTLGEKVVRSFSAAAGQHVKLSVTEIAVPAADLIISGPDGSFVDSLFVFAGDQEPVESDTITLPDAGTYTLTVDAFESGTGSLTFTIQPVAAPAPQSRATVAGEPVKAQAFAATAEAAAQPVLTLTTAEVLANDRPGPPNEADQTLKVTAVHTTAASHGTATLAGETITYTADAGYAGPAAITYTACDNGTTNGAPDPLCSDGTIELEVTANNPPTAAGQQLSTNEDTALPVTLSGNDADGDTVFFRIVEPPAHGTLSGTAPALTYTPAPNFHGTDSFRYATNDTHDESLPATITITVAEVNDEPDAQADSVVNGVGRTTSVAASTLLRNDSPGPLDERGQTLAVTAVTATSDTHGTVSLADGAVTYVPDAGFTGTAKARYTVCDNGTSSGQADPRCAQGELSIVANRAPSATAKSVATQRNTPVTITLAGTDPENDTLSFKVASAPSHGTLTGSGDTRVYTPETGFSGSDSFTFTAADAFSTSAPATVSIEVVATRPPVVNPDAAATAMNTSVLIDVLANDAAGDGSLDPATLAVVVAPTNGTAVVEAGKIRYTPAAGVTPDDRFTYRVCDTFGVCGQAEVTVSTVVPNRPPVAVADNYEMDVNTTLEPAKPGVLGNDSDPDPGDAIQARLDTGVSAGNLLLRSDGSFRYTPSKDFAGVDSFTYHVVDRDGLQSTPVTVTIDVVPLGPAAADDTYTTTKNNPLVVMPAGVLANDRDAHTTDILTANLDRGAFRGTVDLNPDGSFTYIPEPDFVGTDSFRYVATDVRGVPSFVAFVEIKVLAPDCALPTVDQVAPAEASKVTAPVAVTANVAPPAGQTIEEWKVTVRNQDRGTPVVLSSGTGAPPPTLATFDPTLLVNGAYQVLVAVKASGGCTTTGVSNVFVTGDMKLGDYRTTYLDMETSIAGFPIQVMRTYDTTDKRRGDFGVGWRVELGGIRATPNNKLGQGGWFTEPFGFPFTRFRFKTTIPHFVTVTSPGGRVEVFNLVPAPSGPLLSLTTPEYVAKPGTGTTSKLEDADPPTLSSTGTGGSLASFFGGEVYDPRLFRLTSADGTVLIIDRFRGLLSMTDRNGNEVDVSEDGVHSATTPRHLTFVRDGAGRITEIRGPEGKRTQYAYSAAGDLRRFVAADGEADTFSYDAGHRLLTVDGPGGTRLRTLNYGPDGRLTSLTDATGRTTELSSDVDDRREIETSPSGRLTTLTSYGADGNLASLEEVFSGHSRITRYEYDAEGRRIRTIAPLGRVETLTYDAAGNLTSRRTPKGELWSFAYNDLNLPTTTTTPGGTIVESNTYDAKGNLTAATFRDGRVVTYTNDSRGLPVTAVDSFGTTTFEYDADQQLVKQIDPAGGITRQSFDSSGRVSSVENPAGEITGFERNALDQVVEVTAANGSSYTLTYDAFGRPSSFKDTAGRTSRYEYDAAGRLAKLVDRADRSKTYAYDSDGNLATIAYADGELQTGTWDPVGRLISVNDADSSVEFAYNDSDDLVSERTRGRNGVALPDVTLSYTTDPNRRRLSASGPGGAIDYAYDSRGRLTSVQDDAGGVFSLAYDATDRLTGLSRPNGVNDALSYRENRLTVRNASSGGSLRARAEYTLDSLGRRTALTDLDGAHSFAHDLADRLTSATHPAASGLPAESFAYDRVGNRTSWAGSPPGTVNYDAGMQLTSDGTYDYTYDAEGRLTQRRNRGTGGITLYTWSDAGLLMSITAPNGSKSTYRYDALGRRLEVNDDGTVRRFVYSGWNLRNEFDGTNALRATYVAGLFPDSVYEIVRGGTRYYPLFDGVGSVTTLTDAAGASVGRVRYSAFGVPQFSGVTEDAASFTGHQFDAATGLVYARARYYDPNVGRFLSRDPEPAINPYAYAFNAPLEFTDPTGRATAERSVQETKSPGYLRLQRIREIQRDLGVTRQEAEALYELELEPFKYLGGRADAIGGGGGGFFGL